MPPDHPHPEFPFMAALAPQQVRKPPPAPNSSAVTYTLGVCRALHREKLHHTLYNVLLSVARAQVWDRRATVSGIAGDTGVTTRAIHIILFKSPELFETPPKEVRKIGSPIDVRLSAEGVALLWRIRKHINLYVKASGI